MTVSVPARGSPPTFPVRSRRPAVLDAARTALIPLRPLTIGEILDGGFLVVRRNARAMIGLPLVIAGGTAAYVLACVGLWVLLGNTAFPSARIAAVVLAGLLGLLLLVQGLTWMTAILSRVSLQTLLGDGFAPSVSRVTLRSSLPMFWPVFGLSLLQYVAASIVQTALSILAYAVIIPLAFVGADEVTSAVLGILVTVVAFLVSMVLLAYLTLTVPALATEARNAPGWIGKPLRATNPVTAFERAVRLIGLRNLLRAALVMGGAVVIAIAVLAVAAGGATLIIALFVAAIDGDVETVLASPYTLLGIVSFAVVVAISALLAFFAGVTTLLYLDLRMRREGLDLALRFDCVPLPQPSAPPPVFYAPPPPTPGPVPHAGGTR